MECREVKELIQIFMDNELATHETLVVQWHLEACARCTHELEAYIEQDRLWKECLGETTVDSRKLQENIYADLQSNRRVGGLPRLTRLPMARIAAAIILAIGLAFFLTPYFSSWGTDAVYAAAVSDHTEHCDAEMMGAALPKAELDGLIKRYINQASAPDLSAFGYTVQRARPCTVDGFDFLHIVYYHQTATPISLFVRPQTAAERQRKEIITSKNGLRVVSVHLAGAVLILVTSHSDNQTRLLAEAARAQLSTATP